MKASFQAIVLVLFFSLTIFQTTTSWAATANDVNKEIRNAQSLYFKGEIEEANIVLKTAEAMAAEIMTGADDAEKQKVDRLNGRIQKLRTDIGKKMGKTAEPAPNRPESSSSDSGRKTEAGETSGELPSHVLSDLSTVEKYINTVQDQLTTGQTSYARRSLANAQQKLQQMAERKKRYITPEHPEYMALQKRIDALDAQIKTAEKADSDQKAAGAKASADAQAQSNQWIARLKPYVTGMGQPGYDSERFFVAGFTEDQQEMAKRTTIFGKVSADMEAYRASGPGNNASDELQRIVRDIEYAMTSFQESSTSMAVFKLSNAGQKIDYITQWLAKEENKVGTKDLPGSLNKMTFMDARRDLDGAANLIGAEDTRIKALEEKYQAAIQKDAQLAKARVSQTRMIDDKFTGSGLNSLKTKAQEVLASANSDVKVLRTTVVSEDWNEENVIEWTDTSRSILRHRITHSVSAQVAGKNGNETILYSIHIAKDRRADNTWSPLRGHIMFEDPILEENVDK